MTCEVYLSTGPHHLLSLSRQLSQHCSRPWAIRPLTVEDAVNTDMDSFSYASSATMMDDTLTTVSLAPMKEATQFNLRSLREPPGKSGHHIMCLEENRKSGT